MPELVKRQSSEVKDNKKGYLVIDDQSGIPFSAFATDGQMSEEEALNMYRNYARREVPANSSLRHMINHSHIKEVPFEVVYKMAELNGMAGNDVPFIQKENPEYKIDNGDSAEWADGAIDADYKEIEEPKYIEDLSESAGNTDYVFKKLSTLGIEMDKSTKDYLVSFTNKDDQNAFIIAWLLGQMETMKYEIDEYKEILKEKEI